MNIFIILSAIITLAYLILTVRLIYGWNLIPEFIQTDIPAPLEVSVIIAFRNEEENLPSLIKALSVQSYPSQLFEVILVNDHSEDNSIMIVESLISNLENFKLISLPDSGFGKKNALKMAASKAQGKLLLFTDADCCPGTKWISTVTSYYLKNQVKLIASPVIVKRTEGIFNNFQTLEFLSLLGSTAGAFGIGNPIMANGANLTVERETYLTHMNNAEERLSSGDDVFLLFSLKKAGQKTGFLKSKDAAVYVNPVKSLRGFISQRMRWTSKAKHYRDKSVVFTALVVLLMNLMLSLCLILSFFNIRFLILMGIVFIVKSLTDFCLLNNVSSFFRIKGIMKYFVTSQFIYFLYVTIVGIAGNILISTWKGRRVK